MLMIKLATLIILGPRHNTEYPYWARGQVSYKQPKPKPISDLVICKLWQALDVFYAVKYPYWEQAQLSNIQHN